MEENSVNFNSVSPFSNQYHTADITEKIKSGVWEKFSSL